MSRDSDAVHEAIDRWEENLLVDAATAAALREDATRNADTGTRRLSQYLLASTGAAVLLIAGGIFLDWAWPLLDRSGRATLLGFAGIVVLLVGVRFEGARRWLPASYLMQTAGLTLLLAGFIHTDGVWADQTAGGFLVGALALAAPALLAPRAMRRNVVMPAVHLAMSLAYLAVFLDRVTPFSADTILWILDGVLFASMAALVRLVLRDPGGEQHPWALNAFVMSMFAGFVLVAWTSIEVLHLSDGVMYPLDAWLGLAVALTLWGIHRGPAGLKREWFGRFLAYLALMWIPFGFVTAFETLDGPAEMALLLVGGAGVAGFVYGNSEGLRSLMGVATLSFVLALWVWAIDRGGALGAVAALVATAGLLLWVSGRTGEAEPAGG